MGISDAVAGNQVEESATNQARPENSHILWDRAQYGIYALALAGSISIWFFAIRAPLWLDETHSFWQISAGFWQIMPRRGGLPPAYYFILWLNTKIIGTSEIALRIPSVLAMLAAVYLLYRSARELFDRDVALVTAAGFCVHPLVVFESIDARPYAFAALAINSAIFMLVRLRHSNSNWLSAAFGVAAAVITYFHLLFGAILPVLALCFLVAKADNVKTLVRQFGIAFGTFVLVFLPVIPDVLNIFRAKQTFVFEEAATKLADLGWTLAPSWWAYILAGTVLVAAATRRLDLQSRVNGWRVLLCASSGLVLVLILYGVSALTPTNIFVERYRLVAIPGLALCWGLIVSRIDSRLIRVLFCVAVVSTTAYQYFSSSYSHRHKWTFKYALELAEKNASSDNAPVLICSDFPSADYYSMPVGEAAKDSGFFTPLSYYKLSVPVVGLPRALNDEAMRIGSDFVRQAAQQRKRFLAIGWVSSYDTMHWLTNIASETHEVRVLGQPDGVVVLEFTPRA